MKNDTPAVYLWNEQGNIRYGALEADWDAFSVNGAQGTLLFSTFGLERMRINGVGQVGIGTSTLRFNPLLTLGENLALTDNSGSFQFIQNDQLAAYLALDVNDFALINNRPGDLDLESQAIDFNTSLTTEALYINPFGSVGIKTDDPKSSLDVNGDISLSGSIGTLRYLQNNATLANTRFDSTALSITHSLLGGDIVLNARDGLIFKAGNTSPWSMFI